MSLYFGSMKKGEILKCRNNIINTSNKRIFYENLENETIILTDLDLCHSLYLRRLYSCKIIINCKINNLTLEDCKDCNIKFKSIINIADLLRCDNITLGCWLKEMSTVKTELCGNLEFNFNQIKDIQFHVLSTFKLIVFSGNEQLNVKFSMFDEYWRTGILGTENGEFLITHDKIKLI